MVFFLYITGADQGGGTMEIAKRIGGAILGAVEGWLIGGLIIMLMNDSDKFAGSIVGGVIGAVVGALLPIATVVPFILLLFIAGHRESKAGRYN